MCSVITKNAAIAAMSVILALYSIDNLLNAKINPLCALCMGALNGLGKVSATELALASTGMMAAAVKPQRFQRRLDRLGRIADEERAQGRARDHDELDRLEQGGDVSAGHGETAKHRHDHDQVADDYQHPGIQR